MDKNAIVDQLLREASALETTFILGKLAGNSSPITLAELARIDMNLIEEERDE